MDMEEGDEEGTAIVFNIVHVLRGSKLLCVYDMFAATILFLWYAYLGGVIVF